MLFIEWLRCLKTLFIIFYFYQSFHSCAIYIGIIIWCFFDNPINYAAAQLYSSIISKDKLLFIKIFPPPCHYESYQFLIKFILHFLGASLETWISIYRLATTPPRRASFEIYSAGYSTKIWILQKTKVISYIQMLGTGNVREKTEGGTGKKGVR